jgi:hypothetical protein
MEFPKTYYLLMGGWGEYSDQRVWPVALFACEDTARRAAERAEAHTRERLEVRRR